MLAQPALQIKADDIARPAEDEFSVLATAPASRPRRALKHGDTFVVTDSFGDIGATAGGTDGLYHADTRFLSHLELSLNGGQPLLLGSNVRDDNTLLAVDLTNPDYYDAGGTQIVLQKDLLHIARSIFLWKGTAYQRLAVRNHGDRPLTLQIAISFNSDFADLFEVRGLQRSRRGTVSRSVIAPDQALLSYQGLDKVTRRTQLSFDPAPHEITVSKASYRLVLAPGESKPIFLSVTCNAERGYRPAPFLRGLLAAHRELRAGTRNITTVETSSELFNEILCRSAADLAMLVTETPQGAYPYAGIPWYSTTFGRDGIITALQLLWCNPGMARGVLRRLAALQAKTTDPASDAEPGKILHEMRAGEMAALGEVPFKQYYGSVDSTPLFVMLAGLYVERTDDEQTLRELWPAIEAALGWIDGPGDSDRDGFVEYFRQTDKGLANQGWKDSHDAIFHADGRMATGPIALAEVQGYVFAAKQLAARCAERLGKIELARKLDAEATRLAERFDEAFWCPEIETYALALDGDKQPCRVRTSNGDTTMKPKPAKAAAPVIPLFEMPKFDIPSFDMPKFEIPAAFREFAEKGVAQSKDTYEKFKAVAEQNTQMLETVYSNATQGSTEYSLKMIEIARYNTNAAFTFVEKLFGVKSPSELIEVATAHSRMQFETLSAQGKELAGIAQKVATDTAEPIKSGVSKAMKKVA